MTAAAEREQRPTRTGGGPARQVWGQLYELLSSTGFAIAILLILAVASILGILVIDQLPVRGELARVQFAARQDEPLIWLLSNVVPLRPFRCFFFQSLLGLLSLSLLACTIKRWRGSWRAAITLPAASDALLRSRETRLWRTRDENAPTRVAALLRRRLFRLRETQITTAAPQEVRYAGLRFGLARLGPVLTHLGFLLLVVGAIAMSLSGRAEMLWLRPGERVTVPEAGLTLELNAFDIEVGARGRIADYVSTVTLYREIGADTTAAGQLAGEQLEIEVNHPLRERGFSFYQNSYRRDPRRLRYLELAFDRAGFPLPGGADAGDDGEGDSDPQAADATGAPRGMPGSRGPHAERHDGFRDPMTITIPWGERVALPGTRYAVAVDTFLADFRVTADGPALASQEFANPAAQLAIFHGDSLAGRSWYFLFHPGMAVGTAPELPVRIADLGPEFVSGIEIATHPGAPWVWAGFAVMTLGTMLAFLLRTERIWVRLRRAASGWDVAVLHQGAAPQAPEFARAAWERSATPLTIQIARALEPAEGAPVSPAKRRNA